MNPLAVSICQLAHGAHLPLPTYGTTLSAGLDLYGAHTESIFLKSLERQLVPTGVAIALPQGYEAQIRPRSGLSLKQGLTVLNSPGTIDADYRGEIFVLLVNLSQDVQEISPNTRIAQLVIAPHSRVEWHLKQSLDATDRGRGGFGSTGVL
jgi:dUTP pyrophosphatase